VIVGTNAVIAIQCKTGWQYTVVYYDGNTIGPLLARWYKDIQKARRLVRYDQIESLPSDPSLIDSELLEEPLEVLEQKQIFDVRRFCQNYYFLADKPNAKWIYAKGPTNSGRQRMKPGKIPEHRVWVDVIRSKGSLFIHVYFGEEKVMIIGPEKVSSGNFSYVRQAQRLGERLYDFVQEVSFAQDVDGKPKIKLLGSSRKIIEPM